MTDFEYEEEKERIIRFFDEWRTRVGLSHWELHHTWHRETPAGVDGGTVMTVESRWEYLWMHVDVYMAQTRERADYDLESDVVHELCHCLVSPMSSPTAKGKERQLEEYAVSSLTRTLLVMAGKR